MPRDLVLNVIDDSGLHVTLKFSVVPILPLSPFRSPLAVSRVDVKNNRPLPPRSRPSAR